MIYKYFSDTSRHAVANFQNGKISFCHVDSFNDCMEFDATFSDELRIPELEANGGDLCKEIVNGFKLRFRVCCFSRSDKLENMWGYYANGGRGFCLGFDEEKIKALDQVTLLPVVYSSSRIILKNGTEEEFIQQLTHKATKWCCEQEIRAIYTVPKEKMRFLQSESDLETQRSEYDCKMVHPSFFDSVDIRSYPFCAVKRNILLTLPAERLIIGKRCSQELKTKLCSIASNKWMPVEYM